MKKSDSPATRNSWKVCLPLPSQRERLAFNDEYSEEQYERISLGLIPEAMEDKWFIFMEGNVLSFHRSWTGVCVYELSFVKLKDRYSIKEAWVNRDGEQYKGTDSGYDAELLGFLIDNFLLDRNTPFPISSEVVGKIPKGVQQHTVSGSGYPEKVYRVENSGWFEKFKAAFKK